ncbi:hypothetical protein EJB05_01578 [Eragrostis curvula]|uniref:Uncharacterized protein n=1 Tax=Eragrostis curvula TaxID=38414 RepID=A0A5J9WSB4_9POAL|nr:hypothetical protein EJB05_01578 [Eragrostis curvula]
MATKVNSASSSLVAVLLLLLLLFPVAIPSPVTAPVHPLRGDMHSESLSPRSSSTFPIQTSSPSCRRSAEERRGKEAEWLPARCFPPEFVELADCLWFATRIGGGRKKNYTFLYFYLCVCMLCRVCSCDGNVIW